MTTGIETIAEILASDIEGRFDISRNEAERIAEKAKDGTDFIEIWENEAWWLDEENA